ncbi:MAG TPA: CarD family transcriptional regulator, partial [bacterium]|nr:CarD family transcriptional regulator [bacterium]
LADAMKTRETSLSIHGPVHAAAASLVAELSGHLEKPLLVVTKDGAQAAQWVRDLKFFLAEAGHEMLAEQPDSDEPAVRAEAAGRVILFPELHHRPEAADDNAAVFKAHLNASLHSLKRYDQPIGVAPASFLAVRMEDPTRYDQTSIVLKSRSEIRVHDLMSHLTDTGYTRVMRVENPGDFAYRGGILDVYIPLYSLPVRIEFFGDEIVSIREFDALTQRSISRIGTVRIATALDPDEQKGNEPFLRMLDRWFGSDLIVLWLDPDDAIETLNRMVPEYTGALTRRDLPGSPGLFWDVVEETDSDNTLRFSIPARSVPEYSGNYREMVRDIRDWMDRGFTIRIVYHRESVRNVVLERMTMADLDSGDPDLWKERKRLQEPVNENAAPLFVAGLLSRGFVLPDSGTVFLTERDVVGRKRRQPWRRTDDLEEGLSFQDLRPGDLVVHVDHGIGRYDGLQRLQINNKERDFLLLRYAEDQKLYLPVDRLHLIQRYQAVSGAHPRLDKMGGAAFGARKKKVKESVLKLAAELLRLFSKREVVHGFAYPSDDSWQREFELGFEYEETPDQWKAIQAVKSDMETSRPMDRIVCGDVGYGKTEVAMRAAFKAAVAGRQVAVLVPTTILAQQHFLSFQKRFSRFPVKVAMLSRFLNPRDKKEVLGQLARGNVDIIIGTHALLSDSVAFSDLGLLIIDEEHRFGVRHKEKLKQLRAKIDVLTLTATPIPRTLNMSLLGLREISLINTPPEARLPIKTRITKFSRELIRQTILDEVDRNGQVFFVHNRVQSIYAMAELLRTLVPEVRFAVAHGQMSEHKLEKIMLQFLEKDFDVLICTTIIESGLDIPSVNTIIINRADKLGLAQLYQLRGRVGRDRYQAYALLLVPATRVITEKA